MLVLAARGSTRRPTMLIVAVLAVVGLLPLDGTAQFLLAVSMAWAVAAIGVDVFSGYLGQPSFGHAGFVGLGAYGYAILGSHIAPLSAVGGALVIVAVISAVVGLALVRLRDFGLVLGTFFLSFVVTSALSGTTFASVTQAESGLQVPSIRFGGTDLGHGRGYYYLCLIAVLVAGLLSTNYVGSRAGRALRLVKRSEVVAQMIGAPPRRVKLTAFVYSAVLAGAAGVLIAIGAGYIAPESFTAQQSIILYAMAAVGGLGTIAGPILGALLFTLVPNYLQVAKTYQEIFFAVLLLGALVLFRGGLYGLLSTVTRRLRLAFAGPARLAEADGQQRTKAAPTSSNQPDQPDQPTAPLEPGVVLHLDGVAVAYGGVRALDEVGFSVNAGEVHALVGPNGAGKTTLLNCISGLEEIDRGRMIVRSRTVLHRGSFRGRRPSVSRTFQNPSLVADLSCLDNVMLGVYATRRTSMLRDLARLDRRAERETRALATEALRFVGLESGRHPVLASELSLAETKLVDIARAVVMGRALLVMDEPTAGLSAHEMALVSSLISRLRARLTVLVVSHHVGWVKAVAGSVTVLAAGRVIASGEPQQVFAEPLVREVFLGDPGGDSEPGPASAKPEATTGVVR